jgi:hypothetical protein
MAITGAGAEPADVGRGHRMSARLLQVVLHLRNLDAYYCKAGERCQDRPVGPVRFRLVDLTPQHQDLRTEHHDLRVLRCVVAARQ